MSIGNAIKLCRQQKRYTQIDLAKKADLSPSYLSQLERDKRDPTLSTLKSLARALQMPLSILLFLAGENDELKDLDQEISQKLSFLVMELLRNSASEPTQASLI